MISKSVPQKRQESLRTETIRPTFRGLYLERFLHLVEDLDQLAPPRQREAVRSELAWCEGRSNGGLDGLKYKATLLVLYDLLGQGWRILYRQRSIYLERPDYTRGKHSQLDPATVKAQIREAYRDERLAKLLAASTRRFVASLEATKPNRPSIEDLIADGKGLACALRGLPETPTLADLRKVVSPYLQIVEGEDRDAQTGFRLIDIWRYFRYYWAIPYLSTPGRNLHYLIRDASRPYHPVIGIAALGNSVVQLAARDKLIGWSVEGVELQLARRSRQVTRDLPKGSPCREITETEYLESEEQYAVRMRHYAKALSGCMLRALDEEISLISLKGLARKRDCDHPTRAIVQQLLSFAASAELDRRQMLRRTHVNGESVKRTEGKATWKEDCESPLFRRKRAQALAEALFAKCVFQEARMEQDPLPAIQQMLGTEDGRKAIRTALLANKKTKIGCNMMDIIVCGAIPPFNEMLGGKLVAMLMASPQVVHDYAERYEGQPSEIVSRIAGKAITRPAHLVLVGTTSLYHIGSSQYERIKIPCPGGEQITFEFVGYTEGYGSTVLSSETTSLLRDMTTESHGMRRVNNVFGEGISPRLRFTREGLALLGIPQTLVLKHSCPRMIYAVRLAKNSMEYLRGESSRPKYFLPQSHFRQGTAAIVDHWLERWLVPRARREESLRKIEQCRKEEMLLSHEIARCEQSSLQTAPQGGSYGSDC